MQKEGFGIRRNPNFFRYLKNFLWPGWRYWKCFLQLNSVTFSTQLVGSTKYIYRIINNNNIDISDLVRRDQWWSLVFDGAELFRPIQCVPTLMIQSQLMTAVYFFVGAAPISTLQHFSDLSKIVQRWSLVFWDRSVKCFPGLDFRHMVLMLKIFWKKGSEKTHRNFFWISRAATRSIKIGKNLSCSWYQNLPFTSKRIFFLNSWHRIFFCSSIFGDFWSSKEPKKSHFRGVQPLLKFAKIGRLYRRLVQRFADIRAEIQPPLWWFSSTVCSDLSNEPSPAKIGYGTDWELICPLFLILKPYTRKENTQLFFCDELWIESNLLLGISLETAKNMA